MRRRLAESLAVVLSVASLGAGAASRPSSLEAAIIQPRVIQTSAPTIKPRKSPAYQVGTASWYGEQFQGKQTASGEPYDMQDFTAAHPNLAAGNVCEGDKPAQRPCRRGAYQRPRPGSRWPDHRRFLQCRACLGVQRPRYPEGPHRPLSSPDSSSAGTCSQSSCSQSTIKPLDSAASVRKIWTRASVSSLL